MGHPLRFNMLALSATLLVSGGAARAQPVADFYRGKTVQMLIGGAPGVSYDFVGRLAAQHMPKYIPGEPTFIVENMPGASSLIMTNYLYNRSKRDGSVIGMPNTNIIFEPTLKLLSRDGGNIQFDLNKFIWLGTPVQEPQVMMVWRGAPAQSLEQMKTTKLRFGSAAIGADNYTLPNVVNRIWGTRNEIVAGYKSPNDIFLAVERGEVDAVSAALSTFLVNKGDWLRDNKVVLLMQFGLTRVPELQDLPTALEQAPNPEAKEMLHFIGTKFALARPFVLPPDVPADRVKALRVAFDALMKDPAFIADAKKLSIDIKPIDGETMTKMIADLNATPQPIIDRLRAVIAP
jgi:tripartite-type tricarboxylate transporter receptor subunit TctC